MDPYRSKLDQILRDLAEKAEERLVEEEDIKLAQGENDVMPPPTTPSKKSGRAPRKRRRKEAASEEYVDNTRPTYIFKLFDRSVDMAQFRKDSSMYVMCRAWTLNKPHVSYELGDRRELEDPQELPEVEDGQYVYSLTKPVKQEPTDNALPAFVKSADTEAHLDTVMSTSANIHFLKAENIARWQSIRSKTVQGELLSQNGVRTSIESPETFSFNVAQDFEKILMAILPSKLIHPNPFDFDPSRNLTFQFAMDLIKTSKVDNVRLVAPSKKQKHVVGTLHLTTTHLIFIDPHGLKETWILHSHIAGIEKLPLTAAGSPLRIRTKNFNIVTFVISRERDCANVFDTLTEFSSPKSIEDLYAFHYSPQEDKLVQSAGWQLYDITTEFYRMQIPAELWVESKMNRDYKLSSTYPPILVIPASATAEIIIGSAQFRSKGRFPALSYYHSSTKAAICRSAQPLAGFNTRSAEDEKMLQSIVNSNPGSTDMYIIDTRPKINAMANRAAGKGYENVENYDNVKFQFIGIENIHVMRQSLQKMLEVCESKDSTVSTFLNTIESSGWLKHVKAVLDTSVFISKAVDVEKCSVLVHCSDGWDRTAQTCSLAGIMLDPYYRTIHGFQVLIEKEWLSFGHKFVDRCGFLSGDSKETSPIFTQFLDCVWQLLQQFPTAFQFNERFLLTIHTHLYSCQFGTFLGNCCRERKEARLSERTFSLWGFMWQHISEYMNPFFKEGCHLILTPSTAPQHVRFWRSLYCRFNNEVHPRESVADMVCALDDQNESLQDHIKMLSKKIEEMKKALSKNKDEEQPSEKNDNDQPSEKNDNDNDNNEPAASMVLNEGYILNKQNRDESNENEAINLLKKATSFSIEWKSLRGVTQCSCGSPIDYLTRKFNCWNCGDVFCSRCIDRQSTLPAHYSENKVPVCKPCFKLLRR